MFYDWKPYVPVAVRRKRALASMNRRRKQGEVVRPVVISGKKIANTFWGKAWCTHLESYSDFSNRLPRGRTYVRNGSVVDLAIHPGKVAAFVMGSSLYEVKVEITPLPKARWKELTAECSGSIDSLVELLQGRFAKGVMERLCDPRAGLFPKPAGISFSCSCPDSAYMCKHIAATLYGVGARLDESPELFFLLRQVDQNDLIRVAAAGVTLPTTVAPSDDRIVQGAALEDLFGLEMVQEEVAKKPTRKKSARAAPRRAASRKPESGASPKSKGAKNARQPNSAGR